MVEQIKSCGEKLLARKICPISVGGLRSKHLALGATRPFVRSAMPIHFGAISHSELHFDSLFLWWP